MPRYMPIKIENGGNCQSVQSKATQCNTNELIRHTLYYAIVLFIEISETNCDASENVSSFTLIPPNKNCHIGDVAEVENIIESITYVATTAQYATYLVFHPMNISSQAQCPGPSNSERPIFERAI